MVFLNQELPLFAYSFDMDGMKVFALQRICPLNASMIACFSMNQLMKYFFWIYQCVPGLYLDAFSYAISFLLQLMAVKFSGA